MEIAAAARRPDHEPDILVERARRQGTFSMDTRHRHSRYEIYWLVAGERLYFVRDRVHRVREGDIVVVGADELHRTAPSGKGGHERVLVEFERRVLPDCPPWTAPSPFLDSLFDPDRPVIRPGGGAEARIRELFAALLAERLGAERERDTMLGLLVAQLLVHLERCAPATNRERLPGERDDATSLGRTINAVCAHLATHACESADLKTVASRFGMSPSYLSRSFHRLTGIRYLSYLASLRVRRARDLIAVGDLSLDRVAGEAGFPSAEALRRAFAERYGVTPRQYRTSLGAGGGRLRGERG